MSRWKQIRKVAAVLWVLMLSMALPTLADEAQVQRIDELEMQVSLLKMKLATAEKRLGEQDAGSADDAEEAPEATEPPRVRPVASVIDLLTRFPTETLPDRDGHWSASAIEQAELRLRYAVWGRPFLAQLELQQVQVKPNPAHASDPSASPQIITITFKPQRLEFQGHPVAQQLEPILIFADDAAAARAQQIDVRRPFRVRGELVTIQKAHFGLGHDYGVMKVYLRNLDLPGLTPR